MFKQVSKMAKIDDYSIIARYAEDLVSNLMIAVGDELKKNYGVSELIFGNNNFSLIPGEKGDHIDDGQLDEGLLQIYADEVTQHFPQYKELMVLDNQMKEFLRGSKLNISAVSGMEEEEQIDVKSMGWKRFNCTKVNIEGKRTIEMMKKMRKWAKTLGQKVRKIFRL